MMTEPLPSGMLTAHFAAAELVVSEMAARRGIDNTPPPDCWNNLGALATLVLEPARVALGPLHITSGYRCRRLNEIVGGARDSQHMLGCAADVVPLACSLGELIRWMHKYTPFDELIYELGAWVHVSYVRTNRRGSVLLATKDRRNRTRYTPLAPDALAALL